VPVRAVLLLIALIGTLATMPVAAQGDGDPASDVLLGENVFYPYRPVVSGSLQRTLNTEAAAAAKAHFPIKVALIASPVDLGVIPDLFGKPQKYADFLDQEISFQVKQPLLVVMASGYGVQGLSPSATAAVASLRKPASANSDDLAQAARIAVRKLAATAGHPIGSPAGSTGSGGAPAGLIAAAVVVVAAAGAAGSWFLVRRRRAGARARRRMRA
jgi:hypothetical protein